MFRVRLSIAIAVLLAIILILAGTLIWGVQRAEHHLQRSQLAHDAKHAYVNVSHAAYRHFKEQMDLLALNGLTPSSREQQVVTREQLFIAVAALKESVRAEIDHIDKPASKGEEEEELGLITQIEEHLLQAIWMIERVQVLRQVGAERSAREMFSTALDETIDRQFKTLIDSAIGEEQEEAEAAARQAERLMGRLKWIAVLTAVFATVFAFVVGLYLWRSLSEPLKTLVLGVREVARGDLGHRITLAGHNEFTYLAKNINQMAEQLARQRMQLIHAQAHLESTVEQRTRELTQANDKLSYLDQVRRRFFADISHELRTPLTAIRGEAEVTLRGRDKENGEYRTALQRIIELSAQLGAVVEDLLFLARSETAGVRFERRKVNFGQLVAEICDETQGLAHTKQLTLKPELPAGEISVAGDPLRLRQLLLILIDNACLYTPIGGGAITIALRREPEQAILTVADQGIGISGEALEHVFERYFRSEEARQAAPAGSGLGLPLAKAIAEAHQGKITLSSTAGRGTTVSVTLPIMPSGGERDDHTAH